MADSHFLLVPCCLSSDLIARRMLGPAAVVECLVNLSLKMSSPIDALS